MITQSYKENIYDETGFYYLQSRYYDPSIRRFINADDHSIIGILSQTAGESNLYAYCGNNPVMNTDESGYFVITGTAVLVATLIGAGTGLVVGGVFGGITAAMKDQNIGMGVLIGALTGGIMGAGAGLASLFVAPIIAGEGVMMATASGTGFFMGNVISTGVSLGIGVSISFGSGAIGGALSDAFTQIVNEGCITDWGSIGISALQWGALNVLGTGLSSFINPRASVLTTASLSLLINHVPSVIGLIFDHLKARGNIGGAYA